MKHLTIGTIGPGKTLPPPGRRGWVKDSEVRVIAVPDIGHAFDRWEGDISTTDNPADFYIVSDMAITAVFA